MTVGLDTLSWKWSDAEVKDSWWLVVDCYMLEVDGTRKSRDKRQGRPLKRKALNECEI